MHLTIVHKLDPCLQKLLDRAVYVITAQMEAILTNLDTLTADLQSNTDVTTSVLTLIQTLAQEIKDAGTDPVALKALTDKLEANTKSLADAVAANTPAAPPVVNA